MNCQIRQNNIFLAFIFFNNFFCSNNIEQLTLLSCNDALINNFRSLGNCRRELSNFNIEKNIYSQKTLQNYLQENLRKVITLGTLGLLVLITGIKFRKKNKKLTSVSLSAFSYLLKLEYDTFLSLQSKNPYFSEVDIAEFTLLFKKYQGLNHSFLFEMVDRDVFYTSQFGTWKNSLLETIAERDYTQDDYMEKYLEKYNCCKEFHGFMQKVCKESHSEEKTKYSLSDYCCGSATQKVDEEIQLISDYANKNDEISKNEESQNNFLKFILWLQLLRKRMEWNAVMILVNNSIGIDLRSMDSEDNTISFVQEEKIITDQEKVFEPNSTDTGIIHKDNSQQEIQPMETTEGDFNDFLAEAYNS